MLARNAVVLGDWSWLHKFRSSGLTLQSSWYASVKDLGWQQVGQVMFAPMVNEHGNVTVEGLSLRLAEDEYLYTDGGAETYITSRVLELCQRANSRAPLRRVALW